MLSALRACQRFFNLAEISSAEFVQFLISASDHLLLDLLAESSMDLRKLIDFDRGLASNFSEIHGWALNEDAFGFYG